MNDDSSLGSTLARVASSSVARRHVERAAQRRSRSGPSTTTSKFPSTGFGSINSDAGTYVSSTDTATIRSSLGLNTNVQRQPQVSVPAGRPQQRRHAEEQAQQLHQRRAVGRLHQLREEPSSGTYKKKYGYRTLMDYLQRDQRYDREPSRKTVADAALSVSTP